MHSLREYYYLVRLDRPIGILLLLWPTLWGLWVAAEGKPDPLVMFVFVAGVVLMRSAGCAVNDFADRHVDPHVERTQNRPLAAGRITEKEALAVFIVLSLLAFVLVLLMNRLTIIMSFAGALLAFSYPFMKRFTHMPQVYLGVAFGWGIPMVFAAQTGSVPPVAWAMFMANVFWAVAYDTAYAMVDREDDLRIGVRSTAILFGRYDRLMIGINHALCLLLLAWVGFYLQLGAVYFISLAVAAGIAGYEQWLMRHRERGACFKAFLNNHYFGMVIFAGLVVHYLQN
ncbi:MAG: 4-hydroxybenzoate octaprenyltransferase [Gammaproteobacteria bacterium]|nr:4-hydroxybenzoate octaprenyltransferase [Gammaproteobacteria bacterium]